jgi:hypothetical protein
MVTDSLNDSGYDEQGECVREVCVLRRRQLTEENEQLTDEVVRLNGVNEEMKQENQVLEEKLKATFITKTIKFMHLYSIDSQSRI